jgi:hypothetical protein
VLPTFLIIGAPKAGTTSLAAYLDAHPEIFIAPEKEVHFFNEHYDRGVEWYQSRFEGAEGCRAVGEATPMYMYRDVALERMTALLPDAKLIAVLRNPIDRAYSHYWWMRALTERLSFADAVRGEIAGERNSEYVTGGRYLDRLLKVCSHYPRTSLHVVIIEQMNASLEASYAAICRFIGVDGSIAPASLGNVLNPSYTLRFPRLRRAMVRTRAWKRLPGDIADRIDRWNRIPFKYPPMDAAIRAELEAYYAEPNAALAAWLGRDLPEWAPRTVR